MNSKNNPKNLKACIVFQFAKYYVIFPNNQYYQNIETKLVIERTTGKISEVKEYLDIVGEQKIEKKYAFTMFLGILSIYDQSYLFFVAECTQCCGIDNKEIYMVNQTSCLPFEEDKVLVSHPKLTKIHQNITEIKKLLSKNHYFSFGYNLSTSKNSIAIGLPTQEHKYAWNYYIFSCLFRQGVSKSWLVSLIQGYVGSYTVTISNGLFTYSLISRRGFANGGTRYYSRGLDDEGNAANWVECEQIIHYGRYIFSHIQVRGSAPIFFEQTGLTANIQITRSLGFTKPKFDKHLEGLKESYKRVLFVNLMSTTKNNEQKLTDMFEELIKVSKLDFVRYEFFDFHAAVGEDYSRLNPIIKKFDVLNQSFKFYLFDSSVNKVMFVQQGVIRTNCLDCLDRTNAFQTKIAMGALDYILNVCSIDLSKVYGKKLLEMLDEKNTNAPQFILYFKNIWADCGDSISTLYAGTGSLTSSVTRKGKKTISGFFDHKFKSINRFFIGHLNLEDKSKQQAIDLLTGAHTEINNVFEESLNTKLKKKIKEYTTSCEFGVYLLTWNVKGSKTRVDSNCNIFSEFNTHDMPDIIIISLQEIIDLSVGGVMMSTVTTTNEGSVNYWKNVIMQQLTKFKSRAIYHVVDCKALAGIFLLVLVQEKHRARVGNVQYDTIKLGWKGATPNKGSVVIKITIDDTSICVSSVHLTAGQSKNNCNSRLENITTLHEKAFQEEGKIGKKKHAKIEKSDYSIILGDTNFRLNLSDKDAVMLIEKYLTLASSNPKSMECNRVLNNLISMDELLCYKDANSYLKNYKEALIMFLPTYKFEVGSQNYDKKKGRTPSFTDRILFWSPSEYNIKVHYYTSKKELVISDHKPVCALLTFEIMKVDPIKRNRVIEKVLEVEGIEAEVTDAVDEPPKYEEKLPKYEEETQRYEEKPQNVENKLQNYEDKPKNREGNVLVFEEAELI